MAAVDEEKLKAIFKRDGLEKVELDLAKGRYFDRNEKFMQALVDLEKRRIDDDRYEKSQKTPWGKTLYGKIIVGVLIGVIVGLCMLGIYVYLGYQSTP